MIQSYYVCRPTCLFLDLHISPWQIRPPTDRPIRKALRTQISPGHMCGEIRHDNQKMPKIKAVLNSNNTEKIESKQKINSKVQQIIKTTNVM